MTLFIDLFVNLLLLSLTKKCYNVGKFHSSLFTIKKIITHRIFAIVVLAKIYSSIEAFLHEQNWMLWSN